MSQPANYKQVKRALYAQGTTLRAWCKAHGFNYRTALNAVSRHTTGKAREPWGPKTRQILEQLGKDIKKPLLPNAN